MKGCLIMVYIQEHHSDIKYIIKDSKFQWIMFVIHTLMRLWMIEFYVYSSLSVYNGWLETVHINNQTIIHFSIYGQNKHSKISAIQVQSIKLMDICMKILGLRQ